MEHPITQRTILVLTDWLLAAFWWTTSTYFAPIDQVQTHTHTHTHTQLICIEIHTLTLWFTISMFHKNTFINFLLTLSTFSCFSKILFIFFDILYRFMLTFLRSFWHPLYCPSCIEFEIRTFSGFTVCFTDNLVLSIYQERQTAIKWHKRSQNNWYLVFLPLLTELTQVTTHTATPTPTVAVAAAVAVAAIRAGVGEVYSSSLQALNPITLTLPCDDQVFAPAAQNILL